MKARINVVTLGVRDLDRALSFYRDGLGLSSPGIIGAEFVGDRDNPGGSVAMFTLDDGLILSLYARTDLAKDANIAPEQVTGSAMSLGYIVEGRENVDQILDQARRAGATVVRPPLERPWGIYSGYFSDPDGHLWEAVYRIES